VPSRLLALALAGAVLLTGCSGEEAPTADGTLRERATALVEVVRSAVEQAKAAQAEESGPVDRRAPDTEPGQEPVLRTDTQTAFDYEEYSGTVQSVFALLDEYWSEALPAEFGVPYTPPERFVYYRPEEGPGPTCGEQQAPPKNAFYCPAGDFIAWDESGLLIPYYVGAGDFAAAFVLAHEYGHAMQARLPEQEELGVLRELQADCFAGAWAAYLSQRGVLDPGDLDEATLAVFTARDVPDTDFTDPRAHGTGFERTRAFADGYESGPGRCAPAPAEEWIVDSR
jgi:predicted metalloprotease